LQLYLKNRPTTLLAMLLAKFVAIFPLKNALPA
jgi:hypothetical protein